MVSKVNGVVSNLPIYGRNMKGCIGWKFPQEQFGVNQETYSTKKILLRVQKANLFHENMKFVFMFDFMYMEV